MVVYVRSKGDFSMGQVMGDGPGLIPACGTTFECGDWIARVVICLSRQTVCDGRPNR